MTQSVLEQVADRMKGELGTQHRDGLRSINYPRLARAALIALRDGVTDEDLGILEDGLDRWVREVGTTRDVWKDFLNDVLQEGEKTVDR